MIRILVAPGCLALAGCAEHGATAFHDPPPLAFEKTASAGLPPPQEIGKDAGEPGFDGPTPCRP